MSDLHFAQAERRNFLVPALIAVVILAAGVTFFLKRMPVRIADVSVTHTAIVPTQAIYANQSKVVGTKDQTENNLYVLTTVRIDNHLKVPLFINDITGILTQPDDSIFDTSAIEKNDLPNLYTTFPKIKPLAGDPLLRETTIDPGGHAEGMVILSFPIDESAWNQRKSASISITFYHQGSVTVEIPRP